MYRTSYSEMVFYFLNYVIKRKDILLLQVKNTAELFSSSFAQVREDDKFAFLSASLPCFVRWCMMNEKGAFCLEITNSYQISLCLFRGASRSKQNWLSESFFQNNSLITFWLQDTVLYYNIYAIRGAKGAFEGFLRVKIRIGKDGSNLSTEKFRRLFRDHTLTTLIVFLMMTNSIGIQTNYSLNIGSNSRRLMWFTISTVTSF